MAETFLIIVQQQGAQQTGQAIAGIAKQATAANSALQLMRKTLVILASLRAAQAFVDIADASIRMENRLKGATNGTDEFNRAQKFLSDLSRQSRTDIEANTVVYSRLLRSTKSLGMGTEVTEKAMRALTFAIEVGGARSMEARNAMIQLTQGFASGAIQGDELRSVVEQLPPVADAIGKAFKMTGGELIAYGKMHPGIYESAKALQALADSAELMELQFMRLNPTISSAITVLLNVAKESQTVALVARMTAHAILFMADNANALVPALGAALAAYILFKHAVGANNLLGWITAVSTMIRSVGLYSTAIRQATNLQNLFNAALARNPLAWWVVIIGAVVTAVVLLYNNFETFRNVVDGLWLRIVQFGSYLADQFAPAWYAIKDAFIAMSPAALAIWEAIQTLTGAFDEFWLVFSPLGMVMKVFGVETTTTTKFISFLATGIAYLVQYALLPFVVGLNGLVIILNALGLVSDDATAKVKAAAQEYVNMVMGLTESKSQVQAYEEAIKKQAEATRLAAEAERGLGGALDGTTNSTVKARIEAEKLAKEREKEEERARKEAEAEEKRQERKRQNEEDAIKRKQAAADKAKNLGEQWLKAQQNADKLDSSIGKVNNSLTTYVGKAGLAAELSASLGGEMFTASKGADALASSLSSVSASASSAASSMASASGSSGGMSGFATDSSGNIRKQFNGTYSYRIPPTTEFGNLAPGKTLQDVLKFQQQAPDWPLKISAQLQKQLDALTATTTNGQPTESQQLKELKKQNEYLQRLVELSTGKNAAPGTPGASGGVVVQMTINTPDASSFQYSQTQINRSLANALQQAVAEA